LVIRADPPQKSRDDSLRGGLFIGKKGWVTISEFLGSKRYDRGERKLFIEKVIFTIQQRRFLSNGNGRSREKVVVKRGVEVEKSGQDFGKSRGSERGTWMLQRLGLGAGRGGEEER